MALTLTSGRGRRRRRRRHLAAWLDVGARSARACVLFLNGVVYLQSRGIRIVSTSLRNYDGSGMGGGGRCGPPPGGAVGEMRRQWADRDHRCVMSGHVKL